MIEKLIAWSFPVLLTALLASIITRKHKENERLEEAKARLRTAFTSTLGQLAFSKGFRDTHEAPPIDKQLLDAIPTQTIAIEEFRFFIPNKKRTAYQQAWDEYKKAADGGIWIAGYPGTESEKDPYGFMEDKIHTILKFTEKL